MIFHLRIDEEDKSAEQIAQRERTYDAAELLREAGFPCRVVEYFTGPHTKADSAAIVVDSQPSGVRK